MHKRIKQIAHDLALSRQKISAIRSGARYLTETEALFIAERIGLSEEEVLVYLAADRSKNHKAQVAWQNIAKKFNGLNMSGVSMACGGLVLWMMPTQDAIAQCVLCALC
ncbi:DUF3693 domain-containing protein [Vibrio splendidus]|uniref:DUF3693 domain-containing protein n=1 Tax=Vibrio splendidus TaxID=29497 RepID=UPI000C84D2F3|nr:DUF3693 domain-containing protein [Vibrio splendidus]PMH10001.1 antirepressor [Vibrio splendidus]